MGKPSDRLTRARHGLLMIAALTIVAAIVLAAAAAGDRRDSLDTTGGLIKMLNLSTPTLFPTGHALRDAGYAHPAVDLRHSPHLPAAAAAGPEARSGSPAAHRRNTQ
jgi:hypothetical protein